MRCALCCWCASPFSGCRRARGERGTRVASVLAACVCVRLRQSLGRSPASRQCAESRSARTVLCATRLSLRHTRVFLACGWVPTLPLSPPSTICVSARTERVRCAQCRADVASCPSTLSQFGSGRVSRPSEHPRTQRRRPSDYVAKLGYKRLTLTTQASEQFFSRRTLKVRRTKRGL